MGYEFIDFEKIEAHIAAVTLKQPKRLNAINPTMLGELSHAVDAIERDRDVHVWLLKGAPRPDGRPCFSAGVDLKAAAEGESMPPNLGPSVTNDIDDMLKPSIAVIDGVASTGAVELALSCDLRVVGEGAQISDWHLKNLGTGLGGWGATTRWSRLVGVTYTKEIILTGKVVTAEEAYRIGFANAVFPSDKLWDEALSMARAIAGMSPEGVRVTLAHLDHTMDMSRDEALRFAQLAPKWFQLRGTFQERSKGVLDKRKDPET